MDDKAEAIRRRIAAGPLVLDGATGTELERRGLRTAVPLWSAAALLKRPELVEQIHRDYVAAGADIIVANTFRTNVRTLRAAGLLELGPELNRLAVELCRSRAAIRAGAGETGRFRPLVAASIGPVADCYCPELVPEEALLADEHAQMVEWLQAARPDLIWIETINTVREVRAAATAVHAAGLPFAISLVTAESGNLLSGEPLEDAVAAVEPLAPLAIGLNCIPPAGVTALLPRLQRATGLPIAVYAHINNPVPIRGWSYAQSTSPAEYAEYARRWRELGALIIGGCCGTTPDHIRALRALLNIT